MSKIGILGTGSWTTALAQVLVDNGQEVIMKGVNPEEIDDINIRHKNEKFFPGLSLPEGIKASASYEDLKDIDILLMGVPVAALMSVAEEVKDYLNHPLPIINVSKGFDPITQERLSVSLANVMGDKCKCVLSLIGPSHAEEVILRQLTCINVVCEDDAEATFVQHLFANEYFRVYRNNDVIGAEIAAATKNIMAIASGALTGLNQGDNARAALMTRGLAEMTRFGLSFGAQKETFLGLNGVGDLIVTCSSIHSRNFQAGLAIGKADSAEEFLTHNTKTTEGVLTTKTVHLIAQEKGISMPITEAVYKVLYEGKKPSEAIIELMKRPLKAENI